MYNRELLRLALRVAGQGRLSDHHGSAEARSRSCGSVMIADVRMDGGRVAAFGQEVKACAVGQASAAILGSHIVGATRDQVARARDDLSNYLNTLHDEAGSWPEVEMIASVRDYPGRHAAALLPYDAALAAIDQAVSESRNVATSES